MVTDKQMENLKKRKKFTTETAREAQPKSVKKRMDNAAMVEDLYKRLGMTAKGKTKSNGERINIHLAEDAADGDLQAAKLVYGILQANAPKETTIEQTDSGIKVVTNNPQVAELIDGLWHKSGE